MPKSTKLRTAALPTYTDNDAISQSLQDYASLLEALPYGFVLINKMGYIQACNSVGRSMFQYRNVDIVGLEIERLLSRSDRKLFADNLQHCLQVIATPAKHTSSQLNGLKKDGSIFPVEARMKICSLAGRELIGCTFRDITTRRRNEAAIRNKEEKLQMALQGAELWIWEYDCRKDIIFYELQNSPSTETTPNKVALNFNHWVRLIHADDSPRVLTDYSKLLTGEIDHFEFEYKVKRKNGNWNWIYSCGKVSQKDTDGLPLIIDGTNLNISKRKYAEEKLKESEERFRSAFIQSAIPMLLVSKDDGIFRVNEAMCELIAYTEEELLRMDLFDLVHPEDRCDATRQMNMAMKGSVEKFSTRSRYLTKTEETKWVAVNVANIKDSQSGGRYAVVQLKDITEEYILTNKLVHEATHDNLTGLTNRREFEKVMIKLLETVKREKTENALVYIDLDQFKVINDTCGHAAGDELLIQVSALICSNLRKHDIIARLGGDEFGVLMECCDLNQARRVISKIHDIVNNYSFVWEDKSFNVSMSSGLVGITEQSEDIIEILKQADAACYAAKDAGRNRVHVYHSQDEDLSRRSGEMQWVTRITKALEEDRFQLYCQPIASVEKASSERLYYEILLRLQEINGDLVPPGAFLPAAERYGLSTRLDKWVIKKTLDWLKAHPVHVEKLDLCCINLSGHSLGDQGVLAFIEKQFENNEIPAEKICFEITETAAIANIANATNFIKSLKQHGCLFALDDFGSGLSSFAYLKTLEVDILKIDGSFVRDIVSDPVDLAMVRSINEIGKVLGKRTTAEFVENNEILEILKEIGVDRAQGYGISRPIPLEDLSTPVIRQVLDDIAADRGKDLP